MEPNEKFYMSSSYEDFIKPKYDNIIQHKIDGYSLVAITLKNFSEYCHCIGHDYRDEVIQKSERQLRSCLKEDEYLVHMYYNCFLLLIHCSADLDSLHTRAHAFHYAVRDEMSDNYHRPLYLKMGFFPIIKDDVTFHQAQYFAFLTQQGLQNSYPETNYDMYYISFKNKNEDFYELENKVQDAIKNRDFKLFIQPKVDLKTGKVVGGEALMRWIDPELGMIPLSSFLHKLEENGEIREVDLYLFEKGCQYIEKWKKEHNQDIEISFNLSRAYFVESNFYDDYRKVFERYDIDCKNINIELLESIVLNDMEQLSIVEKSIQDLGFKCSLDDFGSGFSSFDILANTVIDNLKLDRSLFMNFHNQKEKVLLKHLVDLAHTLNMKVVAEGIENKEYVDYLKEINCDMIQGYYFYHPMPIEEFEEKFVKERSA